MNNQYTLAALSPGGCMERRIQVNPTPREDLRELAAYFAQDIKASPDWWIWACDESGEPITQWGCDDLDRFRHYLDGEPMTTTQTLLAQGGL